MNISLEWLADYLPGPVDARNAAEILSNGGLLTENISKAGNDTVLDVEVTSNRGDCLSHIGVARELAALMRRDMKQISPVVKQSTSGEIAVTIESGELCPHYTARVIQGIKIGPSPDWMQRRLAAVGIRPINNVVDVTNYVMMEMGQPLHAFDLDKLQGGKIIVRNAKPGEKLVSIDGHERRLSSDMLVIADAAHPVALAGVMGGKETEVGDRTVNLLLESARFDPLSVRKTARTLAMKSDSSYRFERGIDPTLPRRASLRAAELIVATAGGQVGPIMEAGKEEYAPAKLELRLQKIKRVLGIDVALDVVMDVFRRLHFEASAKGDRVEVTVPSWRLDIAIEVDLVEEVARVIGYDQIPMKEEISIRLTPPARETGLTETIRQMLVGAGYFEAVTFSWISDQLADDFLVPGSKGLPRADDMVRKADGRLRPSLLPGLLETVARNEAAGTPDARVFEIGSTFWMDQTGTIREERKLALVGSTDLHEVSGIADAVLKKINPSREIRMTPEKYPGYGASARVDWGGLTIGRVGILDKKIADKLGLKQQPAAAELDYSLLLKAAADTTTLKPLPKFPAVRRDLSLVVKDTVRFEQIGNLVKDMAISDLEYMDYITTYRGKPLAKGEKSVTVQLVFRSVMGTLTGDAVEESVRKIIHHAQEKLGATLRV